MRSFLCLYLIYQIILTRFARFVAITPASSIALPSAPSTSLDRLQNSADSTPSTSRQLNPRISDSPTTSRSTPRSQSTSRTDGDGVVPSRRYSGTSESEFCDSFIRGGEEERHDSLPGEGDTLIEDEDLAGIDIGEELQKLEQELERLRQIEMEMRKKKRTSEGIDTGNDGAADTARKKARTSVVEKEIEVIYVD